MYYGQIRRDVRLKEQSKWFSIYKIEGDHDRFANIDYRLIPSVGIGYWFSEIRKWRARAETAFGYQYTNFRDQTPSEGEQILIPRLFAERVFWRDLKIAEDISFYPTINEFKKYRFRSESSLIQPFTKQLSWRMSFIDDYNHEPTDGARKNDYRLITAIDYVF
jgi:hypothetical protein